MRRESDEFDRLVADLLVEEAGYLNDRFQELLQTGTTTLRSSGGNWTGNPQRSWWRDGWLTSEGTRSDGQESSGRARIARSNSDDQLKSAITSQLAVGLAWLQEA